MSPVPYFEPGIGPDPLEKFDVHSYYAPADTNATTNLITPGMPLSGPIAPNNYYVSRPAADAVPTLIAVIRQDQASGLLSCIKIGNAVAGDPPAGHGVVDVPYSGAVPGGNNLQVLADGAGKFKIVAAGLGIGLVRKAAGGRALVEI